MNPLFALLEGIIVRGHTVRLLQPSPDQLLFRMEVICFHGRIVAKGEAETLEETVLYTLASIIAAGCCGDDDLDEFDGGADEDLNEDTKH